MYPKGLTPVGLNYATYPYATSAQVGSAPEHLFDLVKHVKKAHKRMGKKEPSDAEVVSKIHSLGGELGLAPAEAEGLFSHIWGAVKEGAKRAGSRLWEHVKKDPLGTLTSVASLFAP